MNLCFSTKGWHNADWNDFLSTAADLGFSGIEIHNLYAPAIQKKGAPGDEQACANRCDREAIANRDEPDVLLEPDATEYERNREHCKKQGHGKPPNRASLF